MANTDGGDATERTERERVDAEELSWDLRALNRAAAQLDQALAQKIGLRALDYEAMGHIMAGERFGLGPAELGQRLGISTGSATELADRLERAGHIIRARDSEDRRRVNLVPQAESVGRILSELAPLFTGLDDLSVDLSEADRAVIGRFLRGAATQLRTHADRLAGEQSPRSRPGAG